MFWRSALSVLEGCGIFGGRLQCFGGGACRVLEGVAFLEGTCSVVVGHGILEGCLQCFGGAWHFGGRLQCIGGCGVLEGLAFWSIW